MFKELKKEEKYAALIGLIVAAGGTLFCMIHALVVDTLTTRLFMSMICYILVLAYVIFGYKNNKSDLIKYVLGCFAVSCGVNAITSYASSALAAYAFLFAALFSAYIAGRLKKIKSNNFFAIIILIYLLIANIGYSVSSSEGFSITSFIYTMGPILQFIALYGAYNARFNQYRNSLLEERNRK